MNEGWRERLQAAIAASGRSPADICRDAGVGRSYLTDLTRSTTHGPRIDTLAKVAQACGVSLSWIVDGVELTPEQADLVRAIQALPPDRQETVARLVEQLKDAAN